MKLINISSGHLLFCPCRQTVEGLERPLAVSDVAADTPTPSSSSLSALGGPAPCLAPPTPASGLLATGWLATKKASRPRPQIKKGERVHPEEE